MMRKSTGAEDLANGREPVLYNRIAVLRVERGLSRQDLADRLGINYQTVGYLERGEYNPSLDLAFRLAELFRVPIEAIYARRPFRPLSEALYPDTRPPDDQGNESIR
ncbi:MAG TPA: helix-turn-helix transcriptional regulator [Chloroflexota bacterium]|nr:helix-turn-helix transcriptional regulator [Chloroflexota bacterium]